MRFIAPGSILGDTPFDEKVLSKAKKDMKPFVGVHQGWWIFWTITFFPMLILVFFYHRVKLKGIQNWNDNVYYAYYHNKQFVDPNPNIPFWVVCIIFYLLYHFINEVIL